MFCVEAILFCVILIEAHRHTRTQALNTAMKSMCRIIAILLMFETCDAEPFLNEECPRIRRPIDELSNSDLMLYVEGLQAIRANGKYEVMVNAHQEQTEIHRGSSFFFYHTYYVWEVETLSVCPVRLHIVSVSQNSSRSFN